MISRFLPSFSPLTLFHARCLTGQRVRTALAIATLASGLLYFGWRMTASNPDAPVFSGVFLAAELFSFFSLLTTTLIMWRPRQRTVQTAPVGLAVDVLIPTYNEPLEMIRLTAVAALAIRYPHDTWILDDGNRAAVRGLAQELGCRYLARGENTHAKAGNLNYALRHCRGEFIALFDVDHVPEDFFLDRLLGYFSDPRLALVQTPQDYYNTDAIPFDNALQSAALWHDQTLFYGMGQAGRDALGAASFCGTGAVLRRSALDDIGGFATDTVTEDMHTSVRLNKQGWHTAYHAESLAYGVAAADYVEFLQQRLRWGHGNVQTLREERVPFCRGLTAAQRLCYLALGLSYFEGWARLVFYFTPAIVLLTGLTPIGDSGCFLCLFLPYAVCSYFLLDEIGRGDTRWFASERMAMARFPVALLATFGLFLRRRRWCISAKHSNGNVPLHLLLPQLTVGTANLAGIALLLLHPPTQLTQSLTPFSIGLVCLWAMFHALIAFSAAALVLRDAKRSRRPGFALNLLARCQLPDGSWHTLNTRHIDLNQVELALPTGGSLPDSMCLSVLLRDQVFDINVVVVDTTDATVRCQWQWHDAAQRDLFARLLHACSWWRPLVWPASHAPTLLERSARFLRTPYRQKLRTASAALHWLETRLPAVAVPSQLPGSTCNSVVDTASNAAQFNAPPLTAQPAL